MKIRIATLSLTILCLALTAYAGTIYSEGPILGTANAFFITGPTYPNFLGSYQDISNGFVVAPGNGGTPNTLEFGLWIASGRTPNGIDYELADSSGAGGAFGTNWGYSHTPVPLNASTNHFLFTNGYGYDVYDVTIPITSLAMTATHEYWVSLSNATDNLGENSTEAWDIPNGGLGGPATCNFRQSGTNYGDCGLGGESFTLSTGQPTTPEPSSILLFGSGILGLAGVLRRKLTR